MAAPESVWSLTAGIAFDGPDSVTDVAVVSDTGGQRFVIGDQSDFENLTAQSEFNDFLTTIGYGAVSPITAPSNINGFNFRFQAVATGSILVLGGDQESGSETITNDLTAVLAELNLDSGFTNFMNIVSTPGEVIVDASTDIAFADIIGNSTISSASGTPFADLVASDQFEVIGSESNDGTFTISAVELSGARVVVGSVVTEIAGAEITIIKLP